MAGRKCLTDEQQVRDLILCDYSKGLFDVHANMEIERTASGSYVRSNKAILHYYDGDGVGYQIDTGIYASIETLLNADGSYVSPWAGIQSDELKQDFRLPEEVNGDVRFFFGRYIFRGAKYDGARRVLCDSMRFYIIDDPKEVGHIQSVMTIRKLQNKNDRKTANEWRKRFYGNYDDGVWYYLRTTETYDGNYWELRVYPLGFRYLYPNAKGEFVWEETGRSYRDFSRFLDDRRNAARDLCVKVLREHEESLSVPKGDPMTASATMVPDDKAASLPPVVTPDSQDSSVAPMYLKCQMSAMEFCADLNARLNTLRQQGGFEHLENYDVDSAIQRGEYVVQQLSGVRHTWIQALEYVSYQEYVAEMYQKYHQGFIDLAGQVREIEGLLSVSNAYRAEIKVPADEPFGPEADHMRTLCFSYSVQGIAKAQSWLTKERERYYTCKEQLQQSKND